MIEPMIEFLVDILTFTSWEAGSFTKTPEQIAALEHNNFFTRRTAMGNVIIGGAVLAGVGCVYALSKKPHRQVEAERREEHLKHQPRTI